jgi:hypothetical protein
VGEGRRRSPAPVQPEPKEGRDGEQHTNSVEVIGYEIVVEAVTEEDDEERVFTQVTTVTSDIFSITTSPEFVDMVDGFIDDEILVELKIEIIADGDNNNRTITEEVIIEEEE